jgi:hypothetical protein
MFSLCFCQSLFFSNKESRIRDVLTIRKCQKALNSDIYPTIVLLMVLYLELLYQLEKRQTIFPVEYLRMLILFISPLIGLRSLTSTSPIFDSQSLLSFNSKTRLSISDTSVSSVSLESRISGRFTVFNSSEESLKCKVDSFDYFL